MKGQLNGSKRSTGFKIARANLDFDVYGYGVQIIFTSDLKRARDLYDGLLGHNESDMNATGGLHVYTLDDSKFPGNSYVFLKWNAKPHVIAHESSHVIERLFAWIGMRKYDSEILAYHYGWLVGQIMSFQKSLKKGRKK